MSNSPDSKPVDGDRPLVEMFGSSGRTRVVEAFLGKRGTELTAGEVSKLAGVDRSTVSRNVDALVDAGFVERRETPSDVLYRADVDDPAVRALLGVRRAVFGALVENPEIVERDSERDPATGAYVDRAGLMRLLGTPGRTKMMEAFLRAEGEELTGTEIANLAGIDPSTVSRNVDEFLALGMVEQTRQVGTAKLYRLVADHPVVESLRRARDELLGPDEPAADGSSRETGDESGTGDSIESGNV